MRLRTALLPIIFLIGLLGLALTGCGGSDSDDDGSETPSTSTTPGAQETNTDGGGGAGGSTVTLSVTEGEGTVGQPVNVILGAAGVGEPGIGAWTVDVTYDPSVVTAFSCDGNRGPDVTPEAATQTPTPTPTGPGLAFCNPSYKDNIVRSTGAVVQGASGDVPLATITFLCESAGTSDLTISVSTFADATIGEPTDINHTEESSSITCS
jgi:hypothetical protein